MITEDQLKEMKKILRLWDVIHCHGEDKMADTEQLVLIAYIKERRW